MELAQAPYRLRIPPGSPRAHHVITGTATFSRDKGWYPIGEGQRAELAKVLLFDTNPDSPPLFQIVTAEQARVLDKAERFRSQKGTAMNPINPKTGMPDDERDQELLDLKEELRDTRGQIAAMAQQVETLTRAFMGSGAADTSERHLHELEQRVAHAHETSGIEHTHVEKPPTAKDEKPARPGAKPARPGAKADAGAGEKSKAAEEPKVEAKPDDDSQGSKTAIAGYDAALKEQGFTTGR